MEVMEKMSSTERNRLSISYACRVFFLSGRQRFEFSEYWLQIWQIYSLKTNEEPIDLGGSRKMEIDSLISQSRYEKKKKINKIFDWCFFRTVHNEDGNYGRPVLERVFKEMVTSPSIAYKI